MVPGFLKGAKDVYMVLGFNGFEGALRPPETHVDIEYN